ncbi:MAG: hypothetical protein A2V69_01815 [Candidatus Portnoybacteria bacterium RBG_13_40_8]|uniref:Uncharacterized protein n=1 Tax=Candidatus Portnoybacteria bacterium RBG_13_40_8 TaxID=1801990 RepID=A0A1G2F4Y4_9BACT|nr:MAG: hypothetical protein A2V69_01815 [Candidatus Portnoybacteria bacterium RBG_13_40_8]OGZ34741.1 MAG: hypothetical protein A2V60_02300 [Candidatus Portnoybacteria bacterium RIFCSPHIGHO2_01_FULL_39_19]
MNNFKAGVVCDFGIRQIYIKKDGKLIKVEGKDPKEVEKQLHENCDHLVASADEDNIHHNLCFPVWFFQDKIIIFTYFTIGESEQKGITV